MQTATLLRTATAVLALGALAACSSTPPPTDQMAVTRTTVNRVAGEPQVAANAPVELQRARDKLVAAEKAMTDKQYDMARRYAAEAEADARVAETKADAANNAATLQQVRTSIQSLQSEITRRDPAPAVAPGAMTAPMPAPMPAPAIAPRPAANPTAVPGMPVPPAPAPAR
ncbi:DUF4398 domain-containing protein [Paracidovorax cattleyae]|uniref:DUF4398 domain-containing protein n=1 Tax=Paracidovorax cattleyae TaxID=80868 RepID=A0A1H0PE10_9BURK|nr:DUF4398 domain-containing protein [Paracidovorax cattleyae]AVS76013.1 DUF4398 domain-containing protein [Paracidovorax cattleyae]SDP03357.1 protein of unknown function [Paracidovorax cattleyae]